MMLGAHDEAIADCNKAVAIDPTHLRSHLRLAKAFCDQGDFATAEQKLCAATAHHPEHEELHHELRKMTQLRAARDAAEAAYGEGRFEEAHGLFQVRDRRPYSARAKRPEQRIWVTAGGPQRQRNGSSITAVVSHRSITAVESRR